VAKSEREVVSELGSHEITRVWALAAALADGADPDALLAAFGDALSLYLAVVEKLEDGELAGEDEDTNKVYPIEYERGEKEILRIYSVDKEPEVADLSPGVLLPVKAPKAEKAEKAAKSGKGGKDEKKGGKKK
jgi:hypothetical protein